MKTINTLIRFKRRHLEELRRQAALTEEQRLSLLRQSEALQQELESEIALAATQPEMSAFFGNFAERIRKKRTEISGKVALLEKQLQALADEIRDEFSELKRFELVRDQRLQEQKRQRQLAEAAQMDDLALQRFARKEKEEG
ncbi:MAG: flagellar FliJ family protein [Alphaproteobacteria bacterium]|nr:flagellar FliJ family protein [Alphaproteobacteria bacterium]